MYTENIKSAVRELVKAQSVTQWNMIRRKVKRNLNHGELAWIDSSGIITNVLGFDKAYHDFWARVEAEEAA